MSFLINPYSFNDDGVPTENLVLYMRFNNSLSDETGNNTGITKSASATYQNGIYSGVSTECINVPNSADARVTIPDNDILTFGAFSFTCAVKIYYTTAGRFFLSKRNTSSTIEYMILRTNGDNKIGFYLKDQTNGGILYVKGNTALSTSTYHIACTYDGGTSSSGLKIYIDGVEESSYTDLSSGTYTQMRNTSSDLFVGTSGDSGSSGHSCDFDGLALWDKELSQEEITSIYNKQSAGNELL